MASGVSSWSTTAATNATADSNVNWAEGQAPSSVNDSARALMASVAKWRDDLGAVGSTGGSSTAYTATTYQVFASLATLANRRIAITPHTVSGASPTLAVDGLTAKSLFINGAAVGSGYLQSGVTYDVQYNLANDVFQVMHQQLYFAAGTLMVFQQTTAPTGWTKQSTHTDKALRVTSGTASSGGSTAFTSIFASRTITQGNLPNVNLSSAGLSVTTTGGFGGSSQIADMARTGATSGVANSTAIGSTISGTVPLGGSGTAMDFAVQYVDVIIAARN